MKSGGWKFLFLEMDLLRLVLSWQTADSLHRFPCLTRSEPFAAVRATTRGYDDSGDLFVDSTKAGELSARTRDLVKSHHILNRALFLREDKDKVLSAIDRAEKLDFWLLIESGVPEFQAKALEACMAVRNSPYKKNSRISMKCLRRYNDVSAVPWTPQLKTILADLLDRDTNNILAGFLRIPLKKAAKITFSYYIGYCMSVLKGKETVDEVPELSRLYLIICDTKSYAWKEAEDHRDSPADQFLEALMISGYIRPFMDTIELGDIGQVKKVARMALKCASLFCLRMISSNHPNLLSQMTGLEYDCNNICTKWYRDRVLAVLADKDLCAKLDVSCMAFYKFVASPSENPIKGCVPVLMGIPSLPLPNENLPAFIDDVNYKSLQGISFHDPAAIFLLLEQNGIKMRWSQNFHFGLIADAYRKGHFLEEHSLKPCPCLRRPKSPSNGDWEQVLSYLNGTSNTWES